MKVKIFSSDNYLSLEGKIENWLEARNEIKITHILQSESHSTSVTRTLTISIFYED